MCDNHEQPIPGLVLHNWTAPEQVRAFYKGYISAGTTVRYRRLTLHGFRVAQIVCYTRPNGTTVFRCNRMGEYRNVPLYFYQDAVADLEKMVRETFQLDAGGFTS